MSIICAVSDLHGNLVDIPKCDILLIGGDIIPLDIENNNVMSQMWFAGAFTRWVNDLPCQQVIAVAGNHDRCLQDCPLILENLYKATRYKIEFLNNTVTNININDEVIQIWGSPWCKEFGNWAYGAKSETLQEYYSSIPNNCSIVLTHDAPYIGDCGKITEGKNKGLNVGNKVLAKEIKSKLPIIHTYGHIHSSNHNLESKRGIRTKFACVSVLDEDYNIKYKPLMFNTNIF